jgi:hypothetical protein
LDKFKDVSPDGEILLEDFGLIWTSKQLFLGFQSSRIEVENQELYLTQDIKNTYQEELMIT